MSFDVTSYAIGKKASGSSGETFAFICATYPQGATCSCSNGTTTLTATDQTGYYVFSVPSAGTWIVTENLRGKSASVVVSEKGQSFSVSVNTILSASVFSNIISEGFSKNYKSGDTNLGNITIYGNPTIQTDLSLLMDQSTTYASCPISADISQTVYGVLKANTYTNWGRLLSIRSASASRKDSFICARSSENSIGYGVYSDDTTKTGVYSTAKHVYAISADISTGNVKFFVDGTYLGENTFTNLGIPYWVSKLNESISANFYYGAVVSGQESNETIIANMQNIMTYYGIE